MVEKWGQFPVFDGLRVRGNGAVSLGKPGKYNLAVTSGKTPITVMPFTLNVSSNSDPFNPQQRFTRDGLWSVLGYLSRETSNKGAPLHFNWWTNLREFGLKSGSAKCTVELMKGDEVFAELVAGVVVSGVNWQFFSRRIHQPVHSTSPLPTALPVPLAVPFPMTTPLPSTWPWPCLT